MKNHSIVIDQVLLPRLVVLSFFGSVASAQQVALEEIVVTAERRTVNLQTSAVSATVLTGDMLATKGIRELRDLQYAAPALTVSNYESANVTTIRGLGRAIVNEDFPSGVAIYRDGAPTYGGFFQNEPYYDIENIEVYMGPQGTRAGKSAAGGAIFINTKDPELGDEVTVSAEVGVGNYDRFEGTGIVNIPVSDTLAVRASYKHDQRDDFWDNILGSYTYDPGGKPGTLDNHTFRVAVLWQPNEKFKAILKVDYSDLDFGGSVTYSHGVEPLSTAYLNTAIAYTDEQVRVVSELEYAFDNGYTVRSITSYSDVESYNHMDLNGSLPEYNEFKSHAFVDSFSQEITLISPEEDRFNYILGFFYQKLNFVRPYWQDDGILVASPLGEVGPPVGTFTNYDFFPFITTPWDKEEKYLGAFANASYDITEQLSIEAGIRGEKFDTSQFVDFSVSPDFGISPPTIFLTPGGLVTEIEDERSLDGHVSLKYNLNDDHFLYATISRGHVTGGLNQLPPWNAYDSMQVINHEGGWKAGWMDDHLRTQFSGYYQRFDDYQAFFNDVTLPFGGTGQNAQDTSTVWGVEASAQARLNNWSLDFGAAYMSSELGTFANIQNPFTGAIEDLTGSEVPFAPEFNASFGVGYEFAYAGYAISPRADLFYQSSSKAGLFDHPLTNLRARTLVNTQLVITSPTEVWSATFWATNLADHKYTNGIQNNGDMLRAGAPREFGLRLKYNF